MTDPRNVAHDKRVQQEKKHRHEEAKPGADHAVQPGKKPQMAPRVEPELPDVDEDIPPDTSKGAP
jgi:hypothetical protein